MNLHYLAFLSVDSERTRWRWILNALYCLLGWYLCWWTIFSRWYHPPSSHCFGYLSICTVMSCIWITWISAMSCIWITWISVMSCIWITWISVMSCIWITWISVMSCIWITWISVLTWINCFVLVYNAYMPHMWSFLVRYMQS